MKYRTILDLCAGSGAWSQPYIDAGYDVRRIDLPEDVRLVEWPDRVHGILAAPPCTCFSYARNRYPPTDDEIREALSIVDACLRIITVCKPEWWALENPLNKLRTYLGPPQFTFRHWEFGEQRTKPTAIWGNFAIPMTCPTAKQPRSTWQSSQENAKPEDAITPAGFATAFFHANP